VNELVRCFRIDPLGGDVILGDGVGAIAGTVRVGEGCVGIVFGEVCKVGPGFFVLHNTEVNGAVAGGRVEHTRAC
jgi:hypothetical protein